MTTGFELIFDSLFPSRRRTSPEIVIPADEDILSMLEELAHGQEFSVEDLSTMIFKNAVREHYKTNNHNVKQWDELTQRQQETAALACLGYTNAQIAEQLDISYETVKSHIKEILRKFNVRGRHQLRYMLRRWDFNGFDDKNPSD